MYLWVYGLLSMSCRVFTEHLLILVLCDYSKDPYNLEPYLLVLATTILAKSVALLHVYCSWSLYKHCFNTYMNTRIWGTFSILSPIEKSRN